MLLYFWMFRSLNLLSYSKHHHYNLSCLTGDACCPLGSTAVELSYETFSEQWSNELSNVTGCLTTHAKNETLHGSGTHSVALPGETVTFVYTFVNYAGSYVWRKFRFAWKLGMLSGCPLWRICVRSLSCVRKQKKKNNWTDLSSFRIELSMI